MFMFRFFVYFLMKIFSESGIPGKAVVVHFLVPGKGFAILVRFGLRNKSAKFTIHFDSISSPCHTVVNLLSMLRFLLYNILFFGVFFSHILLNCWLVMVFRHLCPP